MQAALSSPAGIEASRILQADEEKFIDPPRISAFLADEETIFDYTAP